MHVAAIEHLSSCKYVGFDGVSFISGRITFSAYTKNITVLRA